jgi:hypothetical protein
MVERKRLRLGVIRGCAVAQDIAALGCANLRVSHPNIVVDIFVQYARTINLLIHQTVGNTDGTTRAILAATYCLGILAAHGNKRGDAIADGDLGASAVLAATDGRRVFAASGYEAALNINIDFATVLFGSTADGGATLVSDDNQCTFATYCEPTSLRNSNTGATMPFHVVCSKQGDKNITFANNTV